jgi:guanylate kinase
MSSSDVHPNAAARGELFVVSAPSGTGKTTLVERLVEQVPGLVMSRSYTSRPARPGEADGVDYNFIERTDFEAMAARGEFLEWADVFGNLYGTRAIDTERLLAAGHDVVLVIDVQGARQVRQRDLTLTSVFVLPPSFEVLECRLRGRSKDADEVILRRLAVARDEVSSVREYDYVIVNDQIDSAVDRLRAIVLAERSRRARMRVATEGILASFGIDAGGKAGNSVIQRKATKARAPGTTKRSEVG